MAKLNVKKDPIFTYEGAKAKRINPELQLRRSVMSCMLWESEFYEDGETVGKRIKGLIPLVKPETCADIAIEAREKMKLRHVPLLIIREMARLKTHKYLVEWLLYKTIQRADELTEFLAIYWKEGRQSLSAQVKRGLASAFRKFDAYQLAKYDREGGIKLRDVLFLCHSKPENKEQEKLWKKLVNKELKSPDTWEVSLSSGKDKKEAWERLLKENKLGALALLRNLRNMKVSDVDEGLILNSLSNIKVEKILPFRFIAAARYAPQWEPQLETAMLKCLSSQDKLSGYTVLLVDVSGSMHDLVSYKSEITRLDTACGVAMLAREICDKVDVYTFSDKLVQVPARRGFALRDAVVNSQEHNGTPLGLAIRCVYEDIGFHKTGMIYSGYQNRGDYKGQGLKPDRLIVITDEQSCDSIPDPKGLGYVINVSSVKNGIGYGAWTHIDGWSEAVLDYIRIMERTEIVYREIEGTENAEIVKINNVATLEGIQEEFGDIVAEMYADL